MFGHQGVVPAYKPCGMTGVVQLVHVSGAACHPFGAVAVGNDLMFRRWLPPECRCFGSTLLLISSESLSLLTSAIALRLDMTCRDGCLPVGQLRKLVTPNSVMVLGLGTTCQGGCRGMLSVDIVQPDAHTY